MPEVDVFAFIWSLMMGSRVFPSKNDDGDCMFLFLKKETRLGCLIQQANGVGCYAVSYYLAINKVCQ